MSIRCHFDGKEEGSAEVNVDGMGDGSNFGATEGLSEASDGLELDQFDVFDGPADGFTGGCPDGTVEGPIKPRTQPQTQPLQKAPTERPTEAPTEPPITPLTNADKTTRNVAHKTNAL